ncbi:hypothetical protein NDU88_006924 [Pleurodeles waltl]|uniref:Uncharacterized protein n=1 Tax=Pleurodeles waltl TaxID=8319 RepID=A0AAV7MGD4_PLEWA|nr:hypothetical protein NDU88_006924 [Pleurodeles waltl]
MFLLALRCLSLRKRPAASLGEAWRLSLHRVAPPGCSGRGSSDRGQVAPLLREEQGSAQQSGCGRRAARGTAWAAGRAFPWAALADRVPGIEGRGAYPRALINWRSPRDPASGGWSA